MKKIICFAITITAFLYTVSAQEIKVKKITDDFVQIITTSEKVVASWQPTIEYSLMFKADRKNGETNKDGQYSILISVQSTKDDLHFAKDNKVLIKTSTDETIQCTNPNDDSYIPSFTFEGWSDNISIRSWIKIGTYAYNIQYLISEADLDKIIETGIKSIRIQTSANNIDCDYQTTKTDQIKVAVGKMKTLIIESINPRSTF